MPERVKHFTDDVHDIVYSTTDFAKTLTRSFPSLKEEYYRIRRRKSRSVGLDGV